MVMTTSEARTAISDTVRRFRGGSTEPVLFGSHRRPEAAIISYDMLVLCERLIEEEGARQAVRDFRERDDGNRTPYEVVLEGLGYTEEQLLSDNA